LIATLSTKLVIHVISGLFFGGGQRVVADLLQGQWGLSGYGSSLVLLGDAGTRLSGLATHTIPYNGRYNSPRQLVSTATKLRKVLLDTSVQIVHSHGVDADFIASLAVLGTSVRQVAHLHITPPMKARESWQVALRRRMFRMLTNRASTRFIAVSEAVRQAMSGYYGIPRERIHTVRNGIDTTKYIANPIFGCPDSQDLVFGVAARLSPMKGIEFLLKAARELQNEALQFHIKIAGEGSLRDHLQRQVHQLAITERVEFLGHIADMRSFYESIDVFVLPSISTEGLPLSVLEAMAMSLPVIATDVGGTIEALRDEVDGLVCPPRDYVALAAAMRRMLLDRQTAQTMARNARQRAADHFGIERVVNEVAAVYEKLLTGSSEKKATAASGSSTLVA
jgi:glycosyltransferase involved in cell wall biosynthesis